MSNLGIKATLRLAAEDLEEGDDIVAIARLASAIDTIVGGGALGHEGDAPVGPSDYLIINAALSKVNLMVKHHTGYVVGPQAPLTCPFPMTEEEYVEAGGGCCPNCGDPQTNVEYRSVDFEGGGVYQRADCGACDFSFYDKYHLAGFEVLEAPA